LCPGFIPFSRGLFLPVAFADAKTGNAGTEVYAQ
jgi:hypothetical protein